MGALIYDSVVDAALLEIEARINDLKREVPTMTPREKSQLWKSLGPLIRDLQGIEDATLQEAE